MKIYYYCSYKGSPVGFRIGCIESNNKNSNFCNLSDKKIDPFIRRCLEAGLVRSAFGIIPAESSESSSFFLLKKKMEGKKQDIDYYMNIAITCKKWDEFHNLMQKGMSGRELASAILDSIEINTDDERFCYQVNKEKLGTVTETAFGDICDCNDDFLEDVHQNKTIYFTLSTATPDLEMLEENLGIKVGGCELKSISKHDGMDKMFRYGKKKSVSKHGHLLKIWMILIAVVFLVFSILAIVKSQF
jgi:hypothetical protein